MNRCPKGYKEGGIEEIECLYSVENGPIIYCTGNPEQCYWWRAKHMEVGKVIFTEEPPRGRNIDLEEE